MKLASILSQFKCYFFILLTFMALAMPAIAQTEEKVFAKSDSLRGSITPERAWWDVTFYDLYTSVHLTDSTIAGHNTIHYRVTDTPRQMQVDLQSPLRITDVKQKNQSLRYRRVEGTNAYYIEMPGTLRQDSIYAVSVYYEGKPKVAENPPWDGGFIWTQDSLGHAWVATANQGIGASVWWPNKDHQSDEPDSMAINITVPDSMVNISNGRLRKTTAHDNSTTTWSWFVNNPINNYSVAVNAGNYVNFTDEFYGKEGPLDISYWVLEQHLELARKQFTQVKPMLRCFEDWFGPYPFYEDSFKIVEAPHLGMEHQSAVAYGNGFQNGYRGQASGWGKKFDFIIVHESGHEWWGNNITTNDIADMWVHEGFTSYSEDIYVECRFGKEAGAEYARGTRTGIQNDRPVIGTYGVQARGSGDMYPKGNTMLHMIRQIAASDSLWKSILRGLQKDFYHQTVTSAQVEHYMNERIDYDLQPVFDQYLRHTDIPSLLYYIDDTNTLYYRWDASVPEFDMPVDVRLREGTYSRIHPVTTGWRKSPLHLSDPTHFEVDPDYYIETEKRNEMPATNR